MTFILIIIIITITIKNLFEQRLRQREPGRLILVRHGESEMNANLSFTGWIDTDITETGVKEMEHCGRLLTERGYTDVEVVYTSILKRSIRSSWVLLREINQVFRPVYKTWRLNQRMYGSLEGVPREKLIADIGLEKVEEYKNHDLL
jgi:2,3-bisphosphoglycerate-dependent phosphoglycerate mutase